MKSIAGDYYCTSFHYCAEKFPTIHAPGLVHENTTTALAVEASQKAFESIWGKLITSHVAAYHLAQIPNKSYCN